MNEPPRPAHVCDQECVCPVHNTPLLYAPAADDHACQDADCEHAHGGLPLNPLVALARMNLAQYPGGNLPRLDCEAERPARAPLKAHTDSADCWCGVAR